MNKLNIPPKKNKPEVKEGLTIKTTKDTRTTFRKKAKALGYKQCEYFALIVKGL
jgi:hypothetical protein